MIFGIVEKNFANITKAAFYLSRLTFCQKNVLERKNSTLADFQDKHLRLPAGKCMEENSEETNFAKNVNSNHFLTLGKKVSNFSPKIPSRALITAFYVSKGRILGKKVWKYTVLCFSRTPRKTLWTLCEEFFAGLSIMHFTRPKEVFGRNFCLKSVHHLHGFQAIIGAGFCTKFFGRVVQSESKVSR